MKDYKEIEMLLDKYWECATSEEEETVLSDFFLHHDRLPESLLPYKPLFVYRQRMAEERLPEGFEQRLLQKLSPSVRRRRWVPVGLKMAASIAFLLGMAYFFYPHSHAPNEPQLSQTEIKETVMDALFMISDNLQKGQNIIGESLYRLSDEMEQAVKLRD
jgi:hypothetical protein